MPETERDPEASGTDNPSLPLELRDMIGVAVRDYGLTAEQRGRLLDAATRAKAEKPSLTVEETFLTAFSKEPSIFKAAYRNALSHHIRTREPYHYDLMVLFAAQSYLSPVLPDEVCVNLAFAGAKSSGKTNATKIATALGGGEFFPGGSLAALRDCFGNGLVGLDEVDTQSKRLEDLEGILRTGNSWNATYPMKVADGKGGWKTEKRNIGGPKVLNFRGKVDDALLSRCYVIELPRATGKTGALAVASLFPGNPIRPFADLLRRCCALAIRGLSKFEVERRMKDPSFIARLDALPDGLARSQQTAAVFLVTSDILGLDLEESVRKAAGAQADADTESDEFRPWLVRFYAVHANDPTAPDLEVPQTDLFAFVNERRKEGGQRPWAPTGGAFASALREVGFEPAKKKSAAGGKRFLTFDANVRKNLGIPESTAPQIAVSEPAEPGSWQEPGVSS
jgi:hypothetical protein